MQGWRTLEGAAALAYVSIRQHTSAYVSIRGHDERPQHAQLCVTSVSICVSICTSVPAKQGEARDERPQHAQLCVTSVIICTFVSICTSVLVKQGK